MTHHYPTPEHERLAREGMYHPESEGDACGVGLIAATDGKPSRRVVAAGIEVLNRVASRDGRDVTQHMHNWLQAKAKLAKVAA
jgi:glutamate synthase (NADPH) large chain